jgi:hypothetical protein
MVDYGRSFRKCRWPSKTRPICRRVEAERREIFEIEFERDTRRM